MMVAVWSLGVLALGTLLVRRLPAASAIAYAVIGFLGIELVVLLVGPLLGLPLPWLECLVWAAVLTVAIIVTVRGPRLTLERRRIVLGAAAASGAVILIGTLALAQVVPGALRIEWAMNSDAVNVVAFSRELLAAGGIVPAASDTPTPLPFAMIASAAVPGRAGLTGAAVAPHDIAALASVWVLLLAACCVLAGAVVARGARAARRPLAVVLTAIASLLMLSWFVTGVQFEFGFVTSAFAIALLLASWLAYQDGADRPALALTALVVATAAIFAVWTPLAIVTVPLGVILAVRERRRILGAGWRHLVGLGAALLLALAYLAGITIPLYLDASSFLAADGGFPAIGPSVIIAILGLAGVAVALAARMRAATDALVGFLGLSGGFVVGLGFLLAQRLGLETMWGYYPAKFAWTVSILLIVIALGAVASLIATTPFRRASERIGAAFGVVLLAGTVWAPAQPQDPLDQFPVVGILRGDAFGLTPGQGATVLALTGRDDGHHVLWGSPFDQWGNRWLLQLDVDDFNTNPVRAYAYLPSLTADDVCRVIDLLGGEVTVHTSSDALGERLRFACPGETFAVSVDV